MAPKRRRPNPSEEQHSSPDPLAISAQDGSVLQTRLPSSPLKRQLLTTPSMRQRSPQKTVLLDPISEPGGASPWRIRVTVQAEPKDEEIEEEPQRGGRVKTMSPSRSPAKRVRTITVPLNDQDMEVKSVKRGRGRPRRSGTPARRPPTPARKTFGHDYDLEDDPTFSPSKGLPDYPIVSPKRSPRKPTRRRSVTPAPAEEEEEEEMHTLPLDEMEENLEPEGTKERSASREPASPQRASKQRSRIDRTTPTPYIPPPNKLSSVQRSPASKIWSIFSSLPGRNVSVDQSGEMSRSPSEISENEDEIAQAQEVDNDYSEEDEEEEQIEQDAAEVAEPKDGDDEGDSDSAEEDYDEEMLYGDTNQVIGDETMMKSMDMTIVSPRSLYSKMDLDSSRLESNTRTEKQLLKEDVDDDIESIPSSPHVKFSSPLIAPTPDQIRRNSRAPSSSRDMGPPPRSSLKSTQLSSSPNVRNVMPFKPLPTPDSEDKSSDDEKQSHSDMHSSPHTEGLKDQQARWQKEREQVAHQARKAPSEQTVNVEDEPEYDEDEQAYDEDDEDEEQEEDDAPLEDETEADPWAEAANTSTSGLQNDNSFLSNRPSIAAYRVTKRRAEPESQRPSRQEESESEDEGSLQDEDEEDEVDELSGTSKQPSDISLLFNQYAASRNVPADQTIMSSPDASKEDLSSLLKRKVNNMMEDVDVSIAAPGSKKMVVTKTKTVPVKFGSSTSRDGSRENLAPAATHYSPKRGSPLKHPLPVDDSDSSVMSDVRQLQEESRAPKRQALEGQVSRPQQPRRSPQKSLLQKTQLRQAERAFPSPKQSKTTDDSITENSIINSAASSFLSTQSDESGDAIENGLLSRLWSYMNPSSPDSTLQPQDPPKAPQIERLRGFPLLPKYHPWSENHFRTLLAIYKHYQLHSEVYSPSRQANLDLIGDEWLEYIDMEFSNWGYSIQLTEELIVVAALFSKLLVLEDADEYRTRYGEELEYGFVGQRTVHEGEITPWHVALRLFTVAVGDVVREEERKGTIIERKKELRWKKKCDWFWKRGWFGGLF